MAAEQPQSHNLRRSQRTKVTPTSYNDADVFDSLLEEALIEHGLTGRKRSREDGDDVELEDESLTIRIPDSPTTRKPAKRAKKRKARSKPFRFLDLPAELRNHIYTLALVDSNTVRLTGLSRRLRRTTQRIWSTTPSFGSLSFHDRIGKGPAQLSPQLLAVCKQVRDEALPILYGQPIICIDAFAMYEFLAGIGHHQQQYLRELVLQEWGTYRGSHRAAIHHAFTMLQNAANLRRFFIDCSIVVRHTNDHNRSLAKIIYRAAHHFLEQYGGQHGRLDAGVDILDLKDINVRNWYYPHGDDPPAARVEAVKQELRELLLKQN